MIIFKNRDLTTANALIVASALLACFTPRFIGFMKVNIGFNMSFYSLLVLLTFFLTRSFLKLRIRIDINSLFLPLLFFAVILDFIRSVDFIGWMQYVFYVLICNLFLILLNRYSEEKLYISIIKAISVAVFVHVLIGFYEITTHHYIFGVGNFSALIRGNVAVSIFFNPNDYSMFISTMIPFIIYLFFSFGGIILKVFNGFIIFGSLFMMITTASRAAILSLVFCGIMLSLILLQQRKYKIIIISLIIICIIVYLINSDVRNMVNQIIISNSIDFSTRSDTSRLNLLKNGLYFLKETHLLGVGAGNLKFWLENRSVYYIGRLVYMHNWYMEVLATFGIIIFSLYMFFHINIAYSLYKYIKQKGEYFGLNLAFFMSFIIFSITSISSSSNIYSEWFWMYIAFISSYIAFLNRNMAERGISL